MSSRRSFTQKHTITDITNLSKLSRKSNNRLIKLLQSYNNSTSSNGIDNDNKTNTSSDKHSVKNVYLMNGFRIRVSTSKTYISIKIGSKKEICIDLVITKPTDQNAQYTAELNLFNYYPSCDIFNSLEHKRGTTLMMNTLINFLKMQYPDLHEITLFDASRYICNSNSRIWFSLYDYYLFKYGSTYYIHNYNFAFHNKIDAYTHEHNKKLIKEFTIDKVALERFLHEQLPKKIMAKPEESIQQFLAAINDNELATDFIKRFKFNIDTCSILQYLFYFVRHYIPEYHPMMYMAILKI